MTDWTPPGYLRAADAIRTVAAHLHPDPAPWGTEEARLEAVERLCGMLWQGRVTAYLAKYDELEQILPGFWLHGIDALRKGVVVEELPHGFARWPILFQESEVLRALGAAAPDPAAPARRAGRPRKRDKVATAYGHLFPKGHQAEGIGLKEVARSVGQEIGELVSLSTLRRAIPAISAISGDEGL